MRYGEREFQHRHLGQIVGVEDHQIRGRACPVPNKIHHPTVVFSLGTRARHHQRFADKATGCRTPDRGVARPEIKLLNRLQGIVPNLPLGNSHPGKARRTPLLARIDHRELTGALADPLGLYRFPAEIEAATVQDSLRHRIEINLSEVVIGANGGEIVIDDAVHHHVITLLVGVEVVEHKTIGSLENPRLLSSEAARIPWDQPKATFPARLRSQTLGSPLLPGDKRQGIKGNGVLQEDRPVWCDGEIVEESESGEAVGTVVEQGASIRALRGELHQPDRASRAGVHPKGDHARAAVMAWVKAGVGAEGLAFLEHPIEQGNAAGLEAVWIQRVGFGCLPKSQKLITKPHHIGVGDVLQPQVKSICEAATRLLAAEHAAVEHLAGLLLRQPTLGAHITVAELNAAVLEPHRGDHAVAIEGVVNPVTVALKPARAVSIKRALQVRRHQSPDRGEGHIRELLLHVDERAGPVAAVVTAGRGNGHGLALNGLPSSRNGL